MKDSVYLGSMEPFQDFFFNSCIYSSIFSVVKYFSGDILPFLINGVGCYMFYNTPRRCSLYIRFMHVEEPINIVHKNGITTQSIQRSKDIHQDIHSALKHGYPVLVMVDCFGESIRGDYYLKKHVPHYLVIFGFDDNLGFYNIIEQNTADDIRFFKRAITFKDLENAYQCYLDNFARDEHTLWWFGKGNKINFPDPVAVYCNNIIQNKSFFKQGLSEKQAFEKRFMLVLANKEEILQYANDIIGGFNDIIKFLECKLYMVKKFSSFEHVYCNIQQIYESWKTIRAIFVKQSMRGSFPIEKKEKISEKILLIDKLEEQLWKSIKEYGGNK